MPPPPISKVRQPPEDCRLSAGGSPHRTRLGSASGEDSDSQGSDDKADEKNNEESDDESLSTCDSSHGHSHSHTDNNNNSGELVQGNNRNVLHCTSLNVCLSCSLSYCLYALYVPNSTTDTVSATGPGIRHGPLRVHREVHRGEGSSLGTKRVPHPVLPHHLPRSRMERQGRPHSPCVLELDTVCGPTVHDALCRLLLAVQSCGRRP